MKTQFTLQPSWWANRLLVVCVLLLTVTVTAWAQLPTATSCPVGSAPTTLRPQPGWTATASDNFGTAFVASNVIDGNTSTAWASSNVPALSSTAPRWVQLDLGSATSVAGLMMLPRRDDETNEGLIYSYLVQLSLDNVNWITAASGTWTYTTDNGQWNVGAPRTVLFNGNSYSARYVRLAAYSGQTTYASVAELSILQCNPPAPAVTINCDNFNLLNSGTNATGTAKSVVNTLDKNWDVGFVQSGLPANPTIANPTLSNVTRWTPAMVSGKISTLWSVSPFGNAEWISYTSASYDVDLRGTETATGADDAQNDYFFRYRFNLADAYQLAAFRVQMDFLADNSVYNVYVNGISQTGKVAGLPQATTGDPYLYGGFTSGNRAQLILPYNWQLGVNDLVIHIKSKPSNNGFLAQNVTFCAGLDFGDAPSTYGINKVQLGAGHIVKTDINGNTLLRMGALLDAEADGVASANATNDNATNLNDEDGVTFVPICVGSTAITANVNVYNTNTADAKLYGWIDFNQNGTFEVAEAASVVAAGATGNYLLTWTGVSGLTAGSNLMARVRLTSDPNISTSTPNNPAYDGEVEDYQITVNPLQTLTADITSQTVCSGDVVTINYTAPASSQVQWTRIPGNVTGFGNVINVPTTTSGPTTYTYTAQTTNGVCPSNQATTVVTVNPRPVVTPSVCSQTICSGQTGNIAFTSSVPGSIIHWVRTPTIPAPASGTGDISQQLVNTGPASLTYTYRVWADSPTPAMCSSSTTITCEIIVTPGLDVTALVASGSGCLGSPLSLSANVIQVGSYTYNWTGPNGYTGTGVNPQVASSASTTNTGSYTVTVTGTSGCSGTATVPVSVSSCCGVLPTANSNSPQCAGNQLQLNAYTQGGSGNFTYRWTGPNGFSSTLANPIIPVATPAATGSYTVVITDATTANCSFTITTPVTIATQPDLVITGGPSLTICSGQSTTLSVAGSNGAPVSWTSSTGQTGTGVSVNTGVLINYGTQPYTVVYRFSADAGTCADSSTVLVSVNPAPSLQIRPVSAVYCNIEQVNITASASPAASVINWTRTPGSPNPPVASGSGTGTVSISEQLPVASYTFNFTATNPVTGCVSQPTSIPVTVQQ